MVTLIKPYTTRLFFGNQDFENSCKDLHNWLSKGFVKICF